MQTKSDSRAPVAIWPDGPPRPLAPYTPAIKAAGWLFISGQLASDFKNGLAPEAASANPNLGNALELQSRYTMKNLANTVKAGGCDIAKDAVQDLAVVHLAVSDHGGIQGRATPGRGSPSPPISTPAMSSSRSRVRPRPAWASASCW